MYSYSNAQQKGGPSIREGYRVYSFMRSVLSEAATTTGAVAPSDKGRRRSGVPSLKAALVAGTVALIGIGSAAPALAAPGPSPMAKRGSCGGHYHPTVTSGGEDAGEADWTLSCKNGFITFSGWVKDLNADGYCAQVKAVFNDGIAEFSARACPKGTVKRFSWRHPGSVADGYLYVTH